jgi:hypothetical protein
MDGFGVNQALESEWKHPRTSHQRKTERLISTATSMDLKLVSKVQFSVIQRGDTGRPAGADYG